MEQNTNIVTHRKKIVKRVLIVILALAFLSACVVEGISIYVGLNLIHPVRAEIKDSPVQYGLTSEEIQFKSSLDGIPLYGWWIPAQKNGVAVISAKTVIFSHGYRDARDMSDIHAMNLAKYLAGEGYNLLLFDYRDSGQSGGSFSSVGQNEKYDLLSAVDFAKDQKHSSKIALVGWSMGASAAITAGVESKDVAGIVADSPFADLLSYLKVNLPVWSNLPDIPFTPAILTTIPVISGLHPRSVSPVQSAHQLGDRKLLLIHSRDDKSIPYLNSQAIYDAVPNRANAELWLTDRADHIQSYVFYPDLYQSKLKGFLSECMGQ